MKSGNERAGESIWLVCGQLASDPLLIGKSSRAHGVHWPLLVLLPLLLSPHFVLASPFATRDQNPLLAGYGLAMPMPSRLVASQEWRFAADFNWGSTAIAQSNGAETLIVDAETRELRMTAGHGFADRWMVQLQLPYRYTAAGHLDGFIDRWHDFFGLPEGARGNFPQDQLHIAYERDGSSEFDAQSSASGVADMAADVGYQLWADADSSVAAWLSLKLPTGDAEKFTGSGAADATLVVAGEQRMGNSWSAFGQAGVTYLRNGELLADLQRDVIWSALAGLSVQVWRGLEFKLQFDAHSAVFDHTTLDFLGEAVILTAGGAYRFESGWIVDAAVSEDLVVEASPDVVLVLGIRRGL